MLVPKFMHIKNKEMNLPNTKTKNAENVMTRPVCVAGIDIE